MEFLSFSKKTVIGIFFFLLQVSRRVHLVVAVKKNASLASRLQFDEVAKSTVPRLEDKNGCNLYFIIGQKMQLLLSLLFLRYFIYFKFVKSKID